MRYESIQYFVTAVNCKSMSLAGEILHISQQSISKEINNLEYELGVKLLKRSSKGVSLTEEGEIAYQSAIQCLNSFANFQNLFSQTPDSQFYNIGFFAAYEEQLHKAEKIFHQFAPLIDFNEFSLSSAQIINELQGGSLDFILHQIETNQNDKMKKIKEYEHILLKRESLMIFLNTDYEKDIFSLSELSTYTYISFSSTQNENPLFYDIATKYGLKPENVIKAGTIQSSTKIFLKKDLPKAVLMTESIYRSVPLQDNQVTVKYLDENIMVDTILSIKKELFDLPSTKRFVDIFKIIFS